MKVSVVLWISRLDRSLPSRGLWMLLFALGAGLLIVTPGVLFADDSGAEEEEEDPTAKLVGMLDPSLAKPLMTLQQEKEFRARRETEYTRRALKALNPNNKEQQLIEEGVRFRVHRLTIPENWPNIANRTKDLVNDIEVFARDAERAREAALRAAVTELDALLFSDQPLFVKINAAWLLGRLNIVNMDSRAKTPAVPYSPAADPLVKVIQDTNQPINVKVAAVRGLGRLLEDGDPSRQQRDKIAKGLTDQLNAIDDYTSGEGRNWYQWRLVDALGKVEQPRSMTQQTFVVDALWKTMHDETLPWRMRARAARSLGQLDLDAQFNVHLLVHEIVLLAGKMTAAYNQNPNLSYWRLCFTDLYFAFKAKEAHQQQRGWGLLLDPPAGTRTIVEGAYQTVLPLVNGVVGNQKPGPVDVNLLVEASKWMEANKPSNLKLHPGAQPLNRDPDPPAENGNTGEVTSGQRRIAA